MQADERNRIIADSVPVRSGAAVFKVEEEFFANASFFSVAGSEPNKLLRMVSFQAYPEVVDADARCCMLRRLSRQHELRFLVCMPCS